jgi:hypothetical protein
MADDRRFYSVTTILKVLDKPGLNRWMQGKVAERAVKVAGALANMVGEDEAAAIKYLQASTYDSSAADLGTAVHAAIEKWTVTGKRPKTSPDVKPYLDRFGPWLDKWQPKFLHTEAAIYSPRYRFAGTLDAVAEIEGCKVLLDYKSHAKPTGAFAESALQLAAYRWADLLATAPPRRVEQGRQRYYLLDEAEEAAAVPMPGLDGACIVSLSPDDCVMYPMRTDQDVFNAFLYVVEVFRFRQELSKTVVGTAMGTA